MAWINTKPPLSYSDVDRLIQHIEASAEKFIDGVVLSTALKFVYGLGLKKGELLCLTVGHVFDQNLSPLNAIRIGPPYLVKTSVIPIPDSFKPTILNYLPYLQNLYGAEFGLTVPLFPNRKKGSYNDTNFALHLDYFAEQLNMEVNLEKIRKTGICKYYDDLRATSGIADYAALPRTAAFARKTKRHMEGILTDQIQQWGGKSQSATASPTAPATAAQAQVSVTELTLRLKNNALPSETEIMEIVERLYGAYIPSLAAMEEFRTELANAAQRNSALNEPEITAAFHVQLDKLGFEINPNDRRMYSRDERL